MNYEEIIASANDLVSSYEKAHDECKESRRIKDLISIADDPDIDQEDLLKELSALLLALKSARAKEDMSGIPREIAEVLGPLADLFSEFDKDNEVLGRNEAEKSNKPYVVYLDDDDINTFDTVIDVLASEFAASPGEAFRIANEVHHNGSFVLNTHKTLAQAQKESKKLLKAGLSSHVSWFMVH